MSTLLKLLALFGLVRISVETEVEKGKKLERESLPGAVQQVIKDLERVYYDQRMSGKFYFHHCYELPRYAGDRIIKHAVCGRVDVSEVGGVYGGSNPIRVEIDTWDGQLLESRIVKGALSIRKTYHAIPKKFDVRELVTSAIPNLGNALVNIEEVQLIRSQHGSDLECVLIEGLATFSNLVPYREACGYEPQISYFEKSAREAHFTIHLPAKAVKIMYIPKE